MKQSSSPAHIDKYEVQNNSLAATDSNFKAACEAAKLKPTGAQASKYRRKIGLAYLFQQHRKNNKMATVEAFLIDHTVKNS